MNRIAALIAVSLLAGCATDGEPVPPPLDVVPVRAPGGMWEVTEAVYLDPLPPGSSPYLGQMVALDGEAGTPAGRFCPSPRYQGRNMPAAEALDGADRPPEATDPTPRPVTEVSCAGEPFGSYVHLPDGSLLTRINAWVLRLDRAKPAIAIMREPELAPAPVTPPPAPATVTASPDPRTIVYLASYKTEQSALAGWRVLAKASPVLARQKPVTQTVDLGRKGVWVRLYAMAADAAERKAICSQLGNRVDECGARTRE